MLPTATGYPQHSGTFVPAQWSGKLNDKFYDATVFGEITNNDWEGEISDVGDKVMIRTTPDIAIGNYTKGQELAAEHPESDVIELRIEHGKYFNFQVDDVDVYQSDIDVMDDWAEDASERMKIEIDTDILADVWADAAADNTGSTAGRKSGAFDMGETGAPVALDKSNIVNYLVDAGSVLSESSIPEQDRFIVLPPVFTGMIAKSELKDASLAGDEESIVRNGRLGRIGRFVVYESNLLPLVTDGTDSVYPCIFGHKSAITFASQMTRLRRIEDAKYFGEFVQGLNVFGYEVVKGDALGVLYAKRA